MPMSADLPDTLTRSPHIDTLPPPAHRLLSAMRAAVVIHRSGQCPRGRLSAILGNDSRAAAWIILLNSASAAWPEPIAVYPPCCQRMTHDEATLIELIACAASGNRPAFDRLVQDMIDGDGRDCLHGAATRFIASFARA